MAARPPRGRSEGSFTGARALPRPNARNSATVDRVRYRRHVLVCIQHREGGGKPACGDRGGCEVLTALEKLLIRDPDPEVAVTGTMCLGPCFGGPNAVV